MTITSPELAVPNPSRREHARQVSQQLREISISITVGKLEANSGPQFGWLEAATGAPMVAAMADLLMKGTA
ncbi:MAG: hypothetical protein ACRDTJ_20550 [Pseudonocardiaceae bacterium]